MQKKFLIAIPALLIAAVLLAGCDYFPGLQTATLNVQVLDAATNQPIQGANVNVYTNYSFSLSNLNKWRNISGQVQGSQNTNENGKTSFNLPTLSSGTTYAVSVYKNNYWANGQEIELTGDKTITIKAYPVRTETLTENNGAGEYQVRQSLIQTEKILVEFQFLPDIKFAAGKTDYNKARDGGNQYFMSGGTRIDILSITNNSITIVQAGGSQNTPTTLTDGQELNQGIKVTVRTNNNGLYLFRLDALQ
jgi:hypothetical protein